MTNTCISVLIVDDDDRFRERLAKSLRARGHIAFMAAHPHAALHLAEQHRPSHATVDLRLINAHGLDVVRDLRAILPTIHIVVLTGYGSIATAVEAMRLGAIDYLTKPADADRILAALHGDHKNDGAKDPSDETTPHTTTAHANDFAIPSLARLEWEHIERVLRECNGNISKAARTLGMHRRTLQYKLAKFPVAR